MTSVRAPFTVTARPAGDPPDEPPAVSVTVFDKVFHGVELSGTGVVHMVAAVGGEGPLAYVALERVDATLGGRSGAFVLRHEGAVVGGVPSLQLEVVPGSGTGGLVGLVGSGTIDHGGAQPELVLDYLLPD